VPLVLDTPAARLIARGAERPLLLEDVEALLASRALVVDGAVMSCATPAQWSRSPDDRCCFALARALGEACRRRGEGRARHAGFRASTPMNRTAPGARGDGSAARGAFGRWRT